MAPPGKIDVHTQFIPPDCRAAAEAMGATPAPGNALKLFPRLA